MVGWNTTTLMIAAEAIVEFSEYRIAEQASGIQLSNKSLFIIELMAVDPRAGLIIFVEVEHEAGIGYGNERKCLMRPTGCEYGNTGYERGIQADINTALL